MPILGELSSFEVGQACIGMFFSIYSSGLSLFNDQENEKHIAHIVLGIDKSS